jgi:hypothetical protein
MIAELLKLRERLASPFIVGDHPLALACAVLRVELVSCCDSILNAEAMGTDPSDALETLSNLHIELAELAGLSREALGWPDAEEDDDD